MSVEVDVCAGVARSLELLRGWGRRLYGNHLLRLSGGERKDGGSGSEQSAHRKNPEFQDPQEVQGLVRAPYEKVQRFPMESIIRKSGYRFSGKDRAQSKS